MWIESATLKEGGVCYETKQFPISGDQECNKIDSGIGDEFGPLDQYIVSNKYRIVIIC